MYEIAQRTLVLRTEPPSDVVVTVGLPYEEPSGDWSCPYRIDGLDGWEHERKVTGFDSLEAMELALAMVRVALAGSHEARAGLLAADDLPQDSRVRSVYVTWNQAGNVAYIAMKHEITAGEAVCRVEADDAVLELGGSGELLGVELTDAATRLPSEMRF
ncbi:hypothetical protein SAMN05421874_104153 [Nonomuraea maritima]|uniref:DUF6968 domain-containing protein n=1 Tax=Nonomuraea maritima TaxID=683260 RepID=A0A1G8XUS2_9ACTN|nr:hypothetical protein [Nonomuraea maritima]SDJ94392.1 hypothetical protein SAMN05421874_104153 [Nonomuraea maritima]